MRRQLMENLAQGPSCDEKIVYIQDSEALSRESIQRHRVKVSVLVSAHESSKMQNRRMIVTREGSAGCANLNFTDQLLEVSRKWRQKSQYLDNVTVYGYDGVFVDPARKDRASAVDTTRRELRGPQVLKGSQYTSDAWLNKTDRLRAAMKAPPKVRAAMKEPPKAKGDYSPVKVCVIDTGFHKSDRDCKKVVEFKDFVDKNNTELRDDTWHGTLTATIILSVYPDCVLYVARVFKNNDTDEKTEPALMVEAINWAMEKNRDVDIISISAGFEEHSPALQDAVQRAAAANKLVFAAAANYGNLRPVAFPARHELFTICIFSTNTLDKGSDFNPEWRADAHNFALLGEDFRDRKYSEVRQSGTSMATAAAAGLAALIVDFSRHPDNKTILRVQDVGKMLGMIAIFKSMSKRTGSLDCVDLEKLYKGAPGERREWVRGNISRAMLYAN
ncbi:subtilisin-like protein [Byssothecium circinans]|uniref:Subtilisin-like protein n=1 Tax=Byssothecium circinans TaxID=147558 RepID=A0A6A5UMS5_9PLEO|nr:subtilisin-like protein [Byssothecium circinans]